MSHPECDSDTVSKLFKAVEENDRHQLMELVSSTHCNPRLVKNNKKETLLHVASKLGFIDMVRTLVEIYQLCPFVVDQSSLTSCERACQSNHLEIVAYFLEIGGYTYIQFDRAPLQSETDALLYAPLLTNFLPPFVCRLLYAAACSKSVAIVRFAWMILRFRRDINVKLNLFLDCCNVDQGGY